MRRVHLIREHHRGRSLDDILKDAYVTNRLLAGAGQARARPAGHRCTRSATTSSPRTAHAASG